MNLTLEQKNAIREQLALYCNRFKSQNKAAESLKGTSKGTVSTILNGKFDNISDDMFRHIAAQIGGGDDWQVCETQVFKEIYFVLDESQRFRKTKWIVGAAGCGKTQTATLFSQERRNVFYVLCSRDMRKSDFVRELARVMGLNTNGLNLRGTLDLIIRELAQSDNPLLVFDEADKLNENVFSYFIDLYNRLTGKTGMVFLSTSHIKKRMNSGLRLDREGYQEIYSRIGRSFFDLSTATANDVFAVCAANGIIDKNLASSVIKRTEACDFDMRRVKDVIEVLKRKEQLSSQVA